MSRKVSRACGRRFGTLPGGMSMDGALGAVLGATSAGSHAGAGSCEGCKLDRLAGARAAVGTNAERAQRGKGDGAHDVEPRAGSGAAKHRVARDGVRPAEVRAAMTIRWGG